MKLYEIAHEHQAAFDLLTSMEELTQQEVEDSMAALDAEFEAKVLSCAKYLRGMEAEADAIKQAEKNMAERRKSIETKAARLRGYMHDNMLRISVDMEKLPGFKDAEIAVSLAKGRDSVAVDDESIIPDEFVRVKREPKKTEIGNAIKAGQTVPGVRIEQGMPSLRIK